MGFSGFASCSPSRGITSPKIIAFEHLRRENYTVKQSQFSRQKGNTVDNS